MQDLKDLEGEIWKDINDYVDLYQISNKGRVKSLQRFVNCRKNGCKPVGERILKFGKNHGGYLNVKLSKQHKPRQCSIQRLVAIHFIPNPENKPQVNHLNGNIEDNRVENLAWSTASENNQHAYDFLGRKASKHMLGKTGKKHIRSKTVYQFSLEGEYIKSYESTNQAAVINGFRQSGISAAALGNYTKSNGYRWSYTDKPNPL